MEVGESGTSGSRSYEDLLYSVARTKDLYERSAIGFTRKISGERALNIPLKPEHTHRARSKGACQRAAWTLLGLLAASSVACGSAGGGRRATTGSGANDGACRPLATEDPPALELPSALPAPPVGEVWLSLDVPVSVIEGEIENYIPRKLAEEQDRPIGGAGNVTYRVTRGKPDVRASGGKVSVILPIEIDLSLCKPLGSLCIGYGSCSPKYEVKASLDLTLDANHELPDVRLSQKVKEGCRVGVDVTDHVTDVVKDQLAEVHRRIRDERPGVAPWIDRAIAELTRPTMLTVGECVALAPDEVLLEGPEVQGDRLRWGVGVRGTVAEAECSAMPHRGRGLPVSRVKERASPRVELRQHVTKDAFTAALEQALARASRPELGFTLQETELTEGQVAFSVDLRGQECGRVWVLGRVGTRDGRVAMESVRLLASQLDAKRRSEIEAALSVELDLGLAAPRFLEDLAIDERTAILATLLDAHAKLDLKVDAPKIHRATVTPTTDGLWILTEISSELHLEAHSRPRP